jgi:hypothetical protein
VNTGKTQTQMHDGEIVYELGAAMTAPIKLSLQSIDFQSTILIAIAGFRFFGSHHTEIYSFNHCKSDTVDILECRLPAILMNH